MSDEAASPKISVVVPIYKVEKYLRDCVESVLAQSFTDFELILVDDGSPDKCGEICDELAKKDSRIRVFHQENGGVTSARRLGVEQARGEWINFVDPDDLLPRDSLKDLIDEATDDTDWVQGMGLRFSDGETPKIGPRTGNVKIFDQTDLAENMLLHHAGPIAKLVRKEFFSPNVLDISREVRRGEDTLMNLRLIANRPRRGKEIDKVVYFYRQQESSVCHTLMRTEKATLHYAKLMLTELRKISTPSNRERLTAALSKKLYGGVVNLIAFGLPIKFPHRLATLIRRSVKMTGIRGKVIYLCLSAGCPSIAQTVTKIFHFLHRQELDLGAKSKTILE